MGRRQEKLKEAMKKLAEREEARAGRKDVSPKGPAIPLADPDSRVVPNKGGGHAPNYTSQPEALGERQKQTQARLTARP